MIHAIHVFLFTVENLIMSQSIPILVRKLSVINTPVIVNESDSTFIRNRESEKVPNFTMTIEKETQEIAPEMKQASQENLIESPPKLETEPQKVQAEATNDELNKEVSEIMETEHKTGSPPPSAENPEDAKMSEEGEDTAMSRKTEGGKGQSEKMQTEDPESNDTKTDVNEVHEAGKAVDKEEKVPSSQTTNHAVQEMIGDCKETTEPTMKIYETLPKSEE